MHAALLLALIPIAAAAQTAVRPLPVVPSVAAIAQADPHSAENAARTALIDSLDKLAATQTAARRAEIAKIQTLAQGQARQTKVRATMLRLIGPLPTRTPLNPQVLGATSLPGVRIEKILFDSQPNFHVTALLYLPEVQPLQKLPAIVMAPGHSPAGKAGDAPFALAFARAGFAVLSYDPIGQGERLQYPDPANPGKTLAKQPTGEHAEASLQPILLGETLARYMLWDGMRAVDYLQSRPEIDPTRIGAFGCSGGGAMTALLGALDPRIAATGTACYITSFDALLPALGPQDGEQSTPGWIAAGLDFPDWIEAAAPRPYAIIATTSDMFPFAGAQSTEAESRRFYDLFASDKSDKSLAFITGPGGHGNLKPILPQILQFFTDHLHPIKPAVQGTDPATKDALQVTSTGQVSTSYPNSATVFSLNLAHIAALPKPAPVSLPELQLSVRKVTSAQQIPSKFVSPGSCCSTDVKTKVAEVDLVSVLPKEMQGSGIYLNRLTFHSPDGFPVEALLAAQEGKGQFTGILIVTPSVSPSSLSSDGRTTLLDKMLAHAKQGAVVLAIVSRPFPSGLEESKSPLLGPYYLLGLRAELVGRPLLGMRVDDVIRAVDYLTTLLAYPKPIAAPLNDITAEASGHEALVLLHAAVLDPRLKHITLTNLPPAYAQILADPLPKDLPEDLLPGVVLHYDLPDLIRALGSRLTLKQQDNQSKPPPL